MKQREPAGLDGVETAIAAILSWAIAALVLVALADWTFDLLNIVLYGSLAGLLVLPPSLLDRGRGSWLLFLGWITLCSGFAFAATWWWVSLSDRFALDGAVLYDRSMTAAGFFYVASRAVMIGGAGLFALTVSLYFVRLKKTYYRSSVNQDSTANQDRR